MTAARHDWNTTSLQDTWLELVNLRAVAQEQSHATGWRKTNQTRLWARLRMERLDKAIALVERERKLMALKHSVADCVV